MENNHTVNSQSGGKVLAMYDIRESRIISIGHRILKMRWAHL